jgi:hypothetical protein
MLTSMGLETAIIADVSIFGAMFYPHFHWSVTVNDIDGSSHAIMLMSMSRPSTSMAPSTRDCDIIYDVSMGDP